MNGLTEIGPSDHFSVERYQRRYTNKTLAVQAVLGIVVLSGITLAVLSHYGCIDHVFVYMGAGGAIASALAALGIFVCCKNNNFRSLWNDYVRPLTFLEEVISELERPSQWRFCISGDRVCKIMDLFKAAQTSEERERLIEEAPQLEKKFFILAKGRVENSLKSHQEWLINTSAFLGWKGYGKRVNDVVVRINNVAVFDTLIKVILLMTACLAIFNRADNPYDQKYDSTPATSCHHDNRINLTEAAERSCL
jgi:hypothetical protein